MPEAASAKQENCKELQSPRKGKERMLRRRWGLKSHPMDAWKLQESTGPASMPFPQPGIKEPG